MARALAKLAARKLAVNFVPIDDLPMYRQDLDLKLPASVVRLKAKIERAAALLFVTPEHNRSIPAVLKNATDRAARPYGHNAWAAKPSAIIGASPGALSTPGRPATSTPGPRQPRRLGHALVMGGEAYIAYKPELIDDADVITDAGTRSFLQSFVDRFAGLAVRLANSTADTVTA